MLLKRLKENEFKDSVKSLRGTMKSVPKRNSKLMLILNCYSLMITSIKFGGD